MSRPEFKACAACAAKSGAPTLCSSCLFNRTVINRLCDELRAVCSDMQGLEHFVAAISISKSPASHKALLSDIRAMVEHVRNRISDY